MATKKKTVHSESASRKLFGAYNDMKLKNSYAQAYMGQKHSSYGNLAKKQTTEILKQARDKAKAEYHKVFGNNPEKLMNMENTLHNAAQGWLKGTTKAQEAYKYVDSAEIKKMAQVIFESGNANPSELQSSKIYFQNLMKNLLECFADAEGLDIFKDFGEVSEEGFTAQQMQQILDGSSQLRKVIMPDAQGAANTIQSLFASLENLLKNIEEGQKKYKWMSSSKGNLKPVADMKNKNIGQSITYSIHSIQGAIVERQMSTTIASVLADVDRELADFGKVLGTSVEGSKTSISTGKFGKSDIVLQGKDNVVGVSAKSAALGGKGKKLIKFHTGGKGEGARDEFFSVTNDDFRRMYFTYNHLRQINGATGNTGWVKSMNEMSKMIAALNIEKVIGTEIDGTPPVYFVAFKDTMIPAYQLYDKLADGQIDAYISGENKTYYDYGWTQERDYELLKSGDYFSNNFNYGRLGYNPYIEYVNSKVLSKVSLAVQIQLRTKGK